ARRLRDAPVCTFAAAVPQLLNETSVADQQQPNDSADEKKLEKARASDRVIETVEQIRHEKGLGGQQSGRDSAAESITRALVPEEPRQSQGLAGAVQHRNHECRGDDDNGMAHHRYCEVKQLHEDLLPWGYGATVTASSS